MCPKTAKRHLENTPANLQLPDVIHKAVAPDTLTNGGIGCLAVTFRRTSPTEKNGGVVSIKIK